MDSFFSTKPKYERLYRGSEDGFHKDAFYSKVTGQNPTLILIQSEQGKVGGAFTHVKWQRFNNQVSNYFPDMASFLFSLTHRTKHVPSSKKPENAVDCYGRDDYIFGFGGGNDFYIANNCNASAQSVSNFGFYYTLPPGVYYQTDDAKNYLMGSYHFKVVEIEAFKVIF